MTNHYTYQISYGKRAVPVYRTYATPLVVAPIAESPFVGRPNILFAQEIDIEVFGDNFLPAYTHGDNSMVVATDSMKNFILRESLVFDGATLEGLLAFLGQRFLVTYPLIESLQMSGRELPFATTPVPGSAGFGPSDLLFARAHGDYTSATLAFARTGDSAQIVDHQAGRVGLQLLKVSGSSFTHFVRDGYTTLPERADRPLFIYLDVAWRYTNPQDALDLPRYVPAEQVRDLVQTVFHEFVSESIQHLVHEIGMRLLERFPQLGWLAFTAQNRTRDPFAQADADPRQKVYTDPFPAWGEIRLEMRRP